MAGGTLPRPASPAPRWGDKVRVSTGGPVMLVTDVSPAKPDSVWCSWVTANGRIIELPFSVSHLTVIRRAYT